MSGLIKTVGPSSTSCAGCAEASHSRVVDADDLVQDGGAVGELPLVCADPLDRGEVASPSAATISSTSRATHRLVTRLRPLQVGQSAEVAAMGATVVNGRGDRTERG
jgi:hypothetical protein